MATKTDSGLYSLKLTGQGISFDREVSEQIANQVINLVMVGGAGTIPPLGSPNLPQGSAGQITAVTQNPGQQAGTTTIKQFVSQKRPENVYQQIACLAYYLTHASKTPHFKTKELTKANTAAALSKLTNPSARVNEATIKYGYLSQAGRGAKQITVFGEQIVEALPNHDRVKQLHADHRSRGRRRLPRKKPKKAT